MLLRCAAVSILLSFMAVSLLGCQGYTANVQPVPNQTTTGEIWGSRQVGQSFVATDDGLDAVAVLLATYNRTNTQPVLFHLRQGPDSEADLATITVAGEQIADNAFHRFSFPPIAHSKGQSYYVFIESPTSRPGDAVTAWRGDPEGYTEGTLYLDGQPAPGHLVFQLHYAFTPIWRLVPQRLARSKPGLWGQEWLYPALFILYAALLGGGLVLIAAERAATWGWLLFGLALFRAVLFIGLDPPWLAPDEPSHFEYAATMAELRRIPSATDVLPTVQRQILQSMYDHDFWGYFGAPRPARAPVRFSSRLTGDVSRVPPNWVVGDAFTFYFRQMGNEPPLYYLVPALVIRSGLWYNPIGPFYAGRFFSALLYLATGMLAWLTARRAWPGSRWMELATPLAVLFNPMFTYMGTAFNNDVIGACLVGAVTTLVATAEAQGLRRSHILGMMGLSLLALFAKKTSLFLLPLTLAALLAYRLRPRISKRGLLLVVASLAALVLTGGALLFLPSRDAAHWRQRPQPWTHTRSQPGAYDGSHAFHLRSSAEARARESLLVQSLPAVEVAALRGQRVRFSAQARANQAGVQGRLALRDDRGWYTADFVADDAWAPVAMTFTLPADATVLRAGFGPGPEGPDGHLFFDDVRLSAVGDSRNLLQNGSAEKACSLAEAWLTWLARPLGLHVYVQSLFERLGSGLSVQDVTFWSQRAFEGFWGFFGSFKIPLGVTCYRLLGVGSVLALMGLVLFFLRPGLWRVQLGWPRGRLLVSWSLVVCLVVLAQTFLPLLARPHPGWGPQGRFLFPAIVPLALLLALGWGQLTPLAWQGRVLPLIWLGWVLLDGVALFRLVDGFYISQFTP